MTGTDLKPFMEESVAEVLEAMCFVSSEGPTDDESGQVKRDWLCGELDFAGHPSGTFGIAVPPETAAILAANFLGDDESILTGEQIVEAVCELTNMVCGALLSHLDPRKAFTLSPPRHDSPGILSPAAKRISCSYRLDEGFIHSWLEIREDA